MSSEPTPIVSVKPVMLPAPGRGTDLQVQVSAPATGRYLPIVVFSHGFGWSRSFSPPISTPGR
jgi:predicted dienelactone hydrolase